MKRVTLATALLGLVLSGSAVAADYEYVNFSYLTNWPAIDAVRFVNRGTFTNLVNPLRTPIPFDTTDTLYFTNRGIMSGSVGFRFDTVTATNRHAASSFFNQGAGTISGADNIFDYYGNFFNLFGGGGFDFRSTPASYVLVNSTNLINNGTISVGTIGLMRLTGKDVDLSKGALVAGDPANINTNLFDTNNLLSVFNLGAGRGLNFGNAYVNPPGVDDLFWGATTNGKLFVQFLNQVDFFTGQPIPFTPFEFVESPGNPLAPFNFSFVSLPLNTNAIFEASVYQSPQIATQKWVNIVFLNTNFTDTNIVASVRFNPSWVVFLTGTNLEFNAVEDVIEFGVPTYDVIHDRNVTNAFYLLDTGGIVTPITLALNLASANTIFRPACFEVTTAQPFEWVFATNANTPYEPELIYPGNYTGSLPNNFYKDFSVNYTSGTYGVQVGRNPESGDGITSSPTNSFLTSPYLVLADPTNQPGRIEINADRLNMTKTRIRAEGLVSLNCKHLTGGGTAGVDAGIINANLASTNGPLLISGVFPPHFKRCRGDIYAWSATWDNVETNAFETNTVHFHCLVVDHNLKADFAPTIRNLTLRSPNTEPIIINDSLRVIRKDLLDTENLTFNSAINFSEQASSVGQANLPRLKNFLNDTNGSLVVDNELRIGFGGHRLDSITNRGIITAMAPLFNATSFENTGVILATNSGSIIIQAENLNLVSSAPANVVNLATLTNLSSQLFAQRDISLSAQDMFVRNSAISAGRSSAGRIELDVTGTLSDSVSGVAGTSNVISNLWETTDGILMFSQPEAGDLFGTQIKSVADGFSQPTHIWSVRDPVFDGGSPADGFRDNHHQVIGRLVLDRKTANSAFRFGGPDSENHYAMFVDYLDLEELAYDSYFEGLIIDDNFTIYFADSNADPIKLTNVFANRLVWVSDFAGPNSSKLVQVRNGGNFCDELFNRALADSPTLDTDLDGVNNQYDLYPFDNVVCNADRGAVGIRLESFNILTGPTSDPDSYSLTLSQNGEGKVTRKPNGNSLPDGGAYELTAVPSAGNVFLGWSGSISSTNSKIGFLLRSNMVLHASFVPNPFRLLKGEYNGLFYETNETVGVRLESSGFVTFIVTDKGSASGRVLMGGRTYPFHSQFNYDGLASVQIPRRGLATLTINLQLDVTLAQNDQVHGDISDGTWDAILLGDHNVFHPRYNPASQAGNYTMVLPGNQNAALSPGGDGFGTASINMSGILRGNGQLADGTRFNQSVAISKNGQWPFYVSLYGGKGSVLGWVGFGPGGIVTGEVNWIKTNFPGKFYAAGFTNGLTLSGSSYTAPAVHQLGLTLTNPVVTLSGGNLGGSITNPVTLNTRTLAFTTAGNHLTLNVNTRAGSFSGKFVHPVTRANTKIQGILLQGQNSARGFFLGTNESGSVRLGN